MPTLSSEMVKEQFSDSERASSTCQAFLVSLAVVSKTYQPRSDPPQLSERGESVNRDYRISLSDDSVKTDLIFFFRGNVGCQVEQLVLCSIAKMKPSRTTPFSKSSVDNNPRDAQSAGFSVLQHASSSGEMSSMTCDTLFPTKVLNWRGLPTSQLNTIVLSVHLAVVDKLHELCTNITWVWSAWFQRLPEKSLSVNYPHG